MDCLLFLYDFLTSLFVLFGSPFPLSFVVIRTGQTEKVGDCEIAAIVDINCCAQCSAHAV